MTLQCRPLSVTSTLGGSVAARDLDLLLSTGVCGPDGLCAEVNTITLTVLLGDHLGLSQWGPVAPWGLGVRRVNCPTVRSPLGLPT